MSKNDIRGVGNSESLSSKLLNYWCDELRWPKLLHSSQTSQGTPRPGAYDSINEFIAQMGTFNKQGEQNMCYDNEEKMKSSWKRLKKTVNALVYFTKGSDTGCPLRVVELLGADLREPNQYINNAQNKKYKFLSDEDARKIHELGKCIHHNFSISDTWLPFRYTQMIVQELKKVFDAVVFLEDPHTEEGE